MSLVAQTAAEPVPIDFVEVVDRHRKDLDIDEMVESIKEIGLLTPITVTPSLRLVGGQRRLEACKKLGMTEIPVYIVHSLNTAALLLRAELTENTCRKAMRPSELVSVTESLMDLERPKAKERQRDAGREHGRGIAPVSTEQELSESGGAVREIAAKAAGWSGPTYQRAKRIFDTANNEAARDDLRDLAGRLADQMDRGEITVTRAHNELRAACEAKPTTGKAADEPKAKVDKSRKAVAARLERIRELGAAGHTTTQIADRVGIGVDRVRDIVQENNIPTADDVVGRRRKIDSNRIVDETVMGLEGTVAVLHLVEVADLDPEQIAGWATSLSNSIRSLNRLTKQLKEIAQ